MPDSAFERASDAVARGNRKVFEEIGREFARFLALPPTELATFPERLRPGDPPDGQEYLRQAFTAYAAAFHESDPKARAELILFANLAIGWHEQTRLQPEIVEALDAPFAGADQAAARAPAPPPAPALRLGGPPIGPTGARAPDAGEERCSTSLTATPRRSHTRPSPKC